LGRLDGLDKELLEEHLLYCGACLDRLETVEGFAVSVREASRMDPPPLVATTTGWFGWFARPAFLVTSAVALLAIFGFFYSRASQ